MTHLGYDKNSYISFEMYEMMMSLGYEIKIEKILENLKPDKISFNNISVKNRQIKTNSIIKNNIEFLNDKRYIFNINTNIPHNLYVE